MPCTSVWPLSLRFAHWLSAVLVVMALGLGACMVVLVHDPGERFELTQIHKSIGIAILALTALRLCLRGLTRVPKSEPAARPLSFAAKAAHAALYALLLLMPLSGWLMATTTPVRVPTLVFGLFALPYPLLPNLATYNLAHAAHVVLGSLLVFLVILHVGAALVHMLLWRDQTVTRMLWKRV